MEEACFPLLLVASFRSIVAGLGWLSICSEKHLAQEAIQQHGVEESRYHEMQRLKKYCNGHGKGSARPFLLRGVPFHGMRGLNEVVGLLGARERSAAMVSCQARLFTHAQIPVLRDLLCALAVIEGAKVAAKECLHFHKPLASILHSGRTAAFVSTLGCSTESRLPISTTKVL